jgi:hypothetical protein
MSWCLDQEMRYATKVMIAMPLTLAKICAATEPELSVSVKCPTKETRQRKTPQAIARPDIVMASAMPDRQSPNKKQG